jgi:hypothetical protein
MAFNGIPPFRAHSKEMTVFERRKLLSQDEFAVIVCAASGDLRIPRVSREGRLQPL